MRKTWEDWLGEQMLAERKTPPKELVGAMLDRNTPNTSNAPNIPNTSPNLRKIMMVGAKVIDARVSNLGVEEATKNMMRVVDQILSDEEALVQTISDSGDEGRSIPWGQLYFLADGIRPESGIIEVEYKAQATKNVLGDLGYTAGWMMKNPFRPARLVGEKIGFLKNPEKYYKMQFERELRRLTNQDILLGLDEWDVSTSRLGRNIYISAKRKEGQ
jgi:hypothetical protein